VIAYVAEPLAGVVGERPLRVAGPHVDVGGFVVSLTARGVPLMPNGVALTGAVPARGMLRLAGAPTWDPTLRLGADPAARGAEILAALAAATRDPLVLAADPARDDRVTRDPLALAVATRDPARAAAAARALIGRGPGLTPEGDDRLAATAAVVAAGRWPEREAWLRAVVPADLRTRTTALSATLLELAARGQVIEPVHGLFGQHWRAALARLLRIGHSTGPAYATAAATAALLS
jgi:hypothetical protein